MNQKRLDDNEYHCEYHPDKKAADKCEICGKKICFDCLKKLEIREHYNKSTTVYKKDTCPVCYYDYTINKDQKKAILPVIGPIIFILIASIGLSGTKIAGGAILFFIFFFSVPGLGIILILYQGLVKIARERDDAIYKKQLFFESLKNYSHVKEQEFDENTIPRSKNAREISPEKDLETCPFCGNEISKDAFACTFCGKKYPDDKILYCQQCGAASTFDKIICEKCGNSLADEKQLHHLNEK